MNEIIEIKVLSNFKIWLKFKDGFITEIHLKPFLGKGITKELLNEEFFNKVEIESGGGLVWPNGYDICPNFLRIYAEEKQKKLRTI